ncbi:MAG: glycosyltransferase family 4 protein [Planctomycetes bacterium]|nr:glycosyltransferase family 4 protein [Planctomycetota bacterium]
MRVLFNGVASLRPKTGIGHYIESLHAHLNELGRDDELMFFPGPVVRKIVGRLLRPGKVKAPSPKSAAPKKRTWLPSPSRVMKRLGAVAFQKAFELQANRSGCELYHEPNYIPWKCELPVVATIHDLSALLHPEWHPVERVRRFETNFLKNLPRCRHLIADSESVRREIIDHLGVPANQVSTVHLGVRPHFRPLAIDQVKSMLADLNLEPGYLLHVGTIEPRKNLLMLMQSYCDLPSDLRERHPLVLVGGWGWRTEEIRVYYETTARRSGVQHLGYAAEENLPALYNGARALVFPSHYEGFGFPPLEMMACGGAVIASTTGSVREILPKGRHLLASDDLVGWREAMRRMLVDDDYWLHSRQGGERHAAGFTGERCARQTRSVYEEVVHGRRALAA